MTRAEAIRADAQAAALAGARAEWLLGGGGGQERSLDGLPDCGLATLVDRFGLGGAALDAFAIAAAPDLGPGPAAAVAAHPLSVAGRATPALVSAALPAAPPGLLSPEGILRRAALVRLAPGLGLGHRPLSVDEAVLQFLDGAPCLSPELAALLTPVEPAPPPPWAERAARGLAAARARAPQPLVHVATEDPSLAARQVAGALAWMGVGAWALEGDAAPEDPAEAAATARLLDRDMALTGAALIAMAGAADAAPRRVLERARAPAILIGGPPPSCARPAASLRAGTGRRDTRRAVWTEALGEAAAGREAEIAAVAAQFDLPAPRIRACAETVALGMENSLWSRAREEAGRALEGLAQRIEPTARWEDLALPPGPLRQLRQIAAFQRSRDRVHRDWGFRARSARGLGLAALFSGPSGAGKTMAAEIVARSLGPEEGEGLDLFRIDLSAIVSKYIGETEKNIARIFDAAERAGAVLIFDEGDALFGRRTSEVRDSVDRHANNETGYLLQRLEAYEGAAIVTTNLRDAVDEAFLRRFRFVVEFPFPDAAQRAAIWRSVLPPEAPVEGLDFGALASLSLAGGSIRSVALTAAFLAAEEGGPIDMERCARAARQEYAKLGKSFPEGELRRRRR